MASELEAALSRALPRAGIYGWDREWLGRQDSNLGMAVPKTAALPLGDAPIVCAYIMGVKAAGNTVFREVQ